ncbi:hypothetical protein D088_340005 [Salmonella enterica subsp. houtenae serovar 16:z4,z32:-- str. RKS3027]|nr:hypothetical protein D088_340005 [Salmonella enterica subsp. houtenae serovar 16:z4,z32:-- str. RKS3027]
MLAAQFLNDKGFPALKLTTIQPFGSFKPGDFGSKVAQFGLSIRGIIVGCWRGR